MRRVLGDLGCHETELSIRFTDDQEMADLNALYLGRTGPTNVLAFPMIEANGDANMIPTEMGHSMLGDVVISVDWAMKEARETGEQFPETVYRFLIHGILHLLGYDHERSTQEAEVMEREEDRLLSRIREE